MTGGKTAGKTSGKLGGKPVEEIFTYLPICVTGMHRTGTSSVAGLLQRHGLWLGDEADIMPADTYNPDGYFENNRLVEVNDAILSAFDGSWSSPPDFPTGWTHDPRLEEPKEKARAMGDRLDAFRPWGFKDPRAALTLPFWRSVWGELTVIVTLRNPLETARSLHRRDGMSLQEGLGLWGAHYRSLLEQTTPDTRTVIEYEGLCDDPVGSAKALLTRLPGLREVDPDLARASVRPPLRHFHATVADLEAQGAPPEVVEMYAQLRAEVIHHGRGAGEQLDQVLLSITTGLSGLDLAIRDVHFEVRRLAAVVDRLEAEIGFVRRDDLAGISSLLENQRSHELPGLASALERIGDALPPLSDRVSAIEAGAGVSGNGRRD